MRSPADATGYTPDWPTSEAAHALWRPVLDPACTACQAAVGRVARVSLSATAIVRQEVCRTALEVAGADVVVLYEADGAARALVTACAGRSVPSLSPGVPNDSPLVDKVIAAAGRRFEQNPINNQYLDRALCLELDAGAVLCEPVVVGRRAVGALLISWTEPIFEVPARVLARLAQVASVAGAAIETALTLEKLRAT